MKIIFAMHGKPKDKRILEKMEEYKTKIGRYQKIDFEFISPPTRQGEIVQQIVEKYKGKKIYLLDEDGKQVSTENFSFQYEKDLNEGVKEVVFVIGPAEGFGELEPHLASPINREGNFKIISLSKLAMQHDIAALVLVEQIYRAVSIKNNLPYHRS